ncbi:MAG TPA: hypothetical protein VMT05_14455 [Terriglobales bacterium]|jgi:hypothetical protein|nr:hypothetical protein [Terriglobales bacterium]
MPTFEQAQIPIENVEGYERLRSAFESLFSSEVESFLKAVRKKGLLIRHYEAVLASGAMEKASRTLKQAGTTARALYEALPMPDRAQVREFYLVRLERVDETTRRRFCEVYRLN